MPLTLTAANNNNSQILSDGIIKHNSDSEMLLSESTTAKGFSTPEMPLNGQRFPLQRQQRAPQQQQQQQQLPQQKNRKIAIQVINKFPLQQEICRDWQRFPLLNFAQNNTTLKQQAKLKFPQQVNHTPPAGHRFPINCQLAKRNFKYAIKATRDVCPAVAMSRSNVASTQTNRKEFPTIKKQFVSFPNHNDWQTCKSQPDVGHGKCQKNEARLLRTDVDIAVVPTPATTATVTQMSQNMCTKIDMDSLWTVEIAENDDDDVSFDVSDVQKATCDNELNAHEQTLNLNVETTSKGNGEPKEIEHQQAENFNDAFGRRHDNNSNNNSNEGNGKGKDEGKDDNVDNDAMNATSIYAKNKHEICEQSKLEATAATHYELNMTKERRQSICLPTTEQIQIQIQTQTQSQTIDIEKTLQTVETTAAASNRQQRISDARGSSSEQVDDQQRQQINVCPPISCNVTQTDTDIEFIKCALRELLDESDSSFPVIDIELFDLLSELAHLFATPPNTGNIWSEASECVDMTVSKVSDESETTAGVVDIYSEQIEQPLELDDNNNSSSSNNSNSNQSLDMKYEVLRSSSRLPETSLSSRLSSTGATVAPAASRLSSTAASVAPATSRLSSTAATVAPATSRLSSTAAAIAPATNRLSSTSAIVAPATSRLTSTAAAVAPATNRLSSTAATVATTTSRLRDAATATVASPITATATSRIRDVALPTASTVRPLLSELKRSSSSRDDLSIDVDSVLPERTRLRRQRRMRSQDSVEEKPEDVIERLNKLKARISGALSEVKGVLKQYSTESEAEAAGEKWLGPPSSVSPKVEQEEAEATQPVSFRFVKKVRRRSYFDEAEEEKLKEKQQEKEEAKEEEKQPEKGEKKPQENQQEKQQEKQLKKQQENELEATTKKCEKAEKPRENETKKESLAEQATQLKTKEEEQQKIKETDQQKKSSEANQTIIAKEEHKKETIQEAKEIIKTKDDVDQKKQTEVVLPTKTKEEREQTQLPQVETATAIKAKDEPNQQLKAAKEQPEKPLINGELPLKTAENHKVQSKIEFLAKVQSELKSKPPKKEATAVTEPAKEAATARATNQQPQPVEAVEATPQTATLPKESATQPANLEENKKLITTELPAAVVSKKKTIVKVRNPRRASIAAVEQSKIVPEVVQSDALSQRRPSDSEAIVKRKKKLKLTSSVTNVTAKTTTSGNSSSNNSSSATATAPQLPQQMTNEQLVAAKVDSNVSTAKSATKPTAKNVEPDEKQTEAAATEATTAPAAAAAAATEATATIETVTEAPKQLAIEDVANKAAASEQSRRASLKLAELVGETVLLVPAATTQDLNTAAATTVATAAEVTLSTAISSSFSQAKEPINQSAIIPAIEVAAATTTGQQQVVVATDIEVAPVDVAVSSATQIAATLSELPHDVSSSQQQRQQQENQQQQQQQDQEQLVAATKDNAQEQSNDSLVIMPELKVLTGPVQPVKIETVEQPHDESDLSVTKKKSPHLKKLVRKSSIDKGKEKVNESLKLSNILKDKNKISNITDRINKATPPKKQVKATKEQQQQQQQQENAESPETEAQQELQIETELEPETDFEPQPEVEPAPKPKKPRQIKKKVIIKRQKRRLSIGDTFFIQQEPEEPQVPEIETIEKAIAYVTDDEDDVEPEPEPEPAKPLKSCLHVREYKIGDLILYAERYRKTQVRWKRGRVLERITSISYKLEIEGKEVPAHISYIKKYTGRKVKFVGKEYLDIDYEQVVEEERRARSYSIWNMV